MHHNYAILLIGTLKHRITTKNTAQHKRCAVFFVTNEMGKKIPTVISNIENVVSSK